MNEKIMKQEATYDFLKDEVHCLYEEKKELNNNYLKAIKKIGDIDKEKKELQSRISMAIEYIRELKQNAADEIMLDKLLDILKGGKE